MAIPIWKKFEQSDGFRKMKLSYRQFIGKEPKLKVDINLATQNYSNWQVVPELIHENDIVYSIGICDDVRFELDIIKKYKVSVFAFDPTPYSVKWIKQQALPTCFQFYSWAVSGKDGKFFLYPRTKKNGE